MSKTTNESNNRITQSKNYSNQIFTNKQKVKFHLKCIRWTVRCTKIIIELEEIRHGDASPVITHCSMHNMQACSMHQCFIRFNFIRNRKEKMTLQHYMKTSTYLNNELTKPERIISRL